MTETSTEPPRTGTMAMLYRLTAGQRHRYVVGTVTLVIAILLEYIVPMIGLAVIDSVIAAADPARELRSSWVLAKLGGPASVIPWIWCYAAAMVILSAIGGGLNFISGRQIVLASETAIANLRRRLYNHIQRLPCGFHDNHATGDLVQRCTSDVETIRRFLAHDVVQIVRSLVLIGTVIPLMLTISVAMTGVAMSMTVPIVVFSALFFKKVKKIFKKADEAEGKLSARLQENLSGIRVVRAFAQQEHEIERFDEVNRERHKWQYRLYFVMAFFWSFSDFLGISQVALVLGLGAYWTWTGRLTIGMLYLFMTWAWKYIFPLRSLGRLLTELGKAQVAMGRVLDIMDQPVEQPAAGTTESTVAVQGRITFDNVTFAYGDAAPVLCDASFVIEQGETVALLGPSGCGKTTALSLLMRLYDCTGGAVRVDGRDIKEIDRVNLREQIAVALQEPFLFSRTISDNIRVGKARAPESEIRQAAAWACVHESIQQFENRYATMVGERGVTLSGGQRQRISLARALLRQAPILLLDDTLSAVDSETEREILSAIEQRHHKSTTLVVAHRLSTLTMADRILVFDEGRVVEQGTHEELRNRPGLYRRLWRMQCELEDSLAAETETEAG
jgi:ATP-binding cassette, subfamily B, bacterial